MFQRLQPLALIRRDENAGAVGMLGEIAVDVREIFLRLDLPRQVRPYAEIEFVRAAEANWKSLAPAVDVRYYPVEILLHLYESLPSPDVRITTYNQSARQISVDGEANTAALAYQFADKVKKNQQLQIFQFTMADPRILPNGHAQYRLEGRPR